MILHHSRGADSNLPSRNSVPTFSFLRPRLQLDKCKSVSATNTWRIIPQMQSPTALVMITYRELLQRNQQLYLLIHLGMSQFQICQLTLPWTANILSMSLDQTGLIPKRFTRWNHSKQGAKCFWETQFGMFSIKQENSTYNLLVLRLYAMTFQGIFKLKSCCNLPFNGLVKTSTTL